MGTRVCVVTPWTLFRCLSRRKIIIFVPTELLDSLILSWSSIVWVRFSFGVVYLARGPHVFSLYIACPGYIGDSAWAIALNFLSKPRRTDGRIGFSLGLIRKASNPDKILGGTFSKGLQFDVSSCFDAFRFYSWWSTLGNFGFVGCGKPATSLLDSHVARPRHLKNLPSKLVVWTTHSATRRLSSLLKHSKFWLNPGKTLNFIIGLRARSCAITHNWITNQGRRISKIFGIYHSRKNTDSFF